MSTEHLAPKLIIKTIGSFDNDGKPVKWTFDGSCHSNSFGVYIDLEKGIELYGGYTIEELKEIRMSHYSEERESVTWPTGEHYMNTYQRKLTSPLVKGLDVLVDVYDVLDAFDVTNPATAHAIKKLLCTGSRGAKDWETDLQEAIDSLERAKSFPPTPF